MPTIVDTTVAPTLAITDPTPADTITVADGPPEGGFQTTQFTTGIGTSTYIFANKTAVTIDGGNHGDNVLLDNPDAATGLASLTLQNLGTGSTITGSNPTANSPDIAVATLSLQADAGVGTSNRALRTQV